MRVGPPRKLSEFEDLTAAEKQLLAEYASGEFVVIGDGKRPIASAGPDHQIRADLIRYLLLGGCAELAAKVHEKGVRVAGAVITGPLDLQGCESKLDLVLAACHFKDTVTLRSARLGSVIFDHSHLPGINADRLVTTGSVSLDGATVTGAVRLLGARIGGNLDCDGATLTGPPDAKGPEAAAVTADGLVTTGGVFLRGATVTGAVRLLGARIGGDLDCAGATLTAREAGQTGQGDAMDLGGARIDGSFFVRGVRRLSARSTCLQPNLAA